MKLGNIITLGLAPFLAAAQPVAAFDPIIIRGDTHEIHPAGATVNEALGTQDVLATGEQTDGQITILIGNDPAGTNTGGVMAHSKEAEMWYVLDGTYEFTIGDEVFSGGPGTFVAVDAGVPRTFEAKTQGRLMLIFTPGGFDQFFKDWDEQGLEPGPELGALEAAYGVTRPSVGEAGE